MELAQESVAVGLVEHILGRRSREPSLDAPLRHLRPKRLMVTGAAGSLGSAVTRVLRAAGVGTCATDVAELDVTRPAQVAAAVDEHAPDVVIHCAGRKWAGHGEEAPREVAEVNALGTANLVDALPTGTRLVTVSTCKACNPETVYGATKLVAERITMNAGGSVARLYNVVESCDNVFELWASLAPEEPLPVAPCSRYFISMHEAVALVLWAAVLPSGRYLTHPGDARRMADVAADLYPGRPVVHVPPRRGDREAEPRVAQHETILAVHGSIERVSSPHDR